LSVRHGSQRSRHCDRVPAWVGLILRYLDAAWADCVVSVESGAAHFCALQGVNFLASPGLFNSIPEW
jgi:hypothetical protein